MDVYRWHEQDSLKNFYEAEISVLERGLDGNFELIELFDPTKHNGRITALGKLKYDNNQEQAILIIFPTKYPSAPPKIIAIGNIQNDDDKNTVGWSAHHFGRGNQYKDGALCLHRKEFWNSNEHNIGWTLRRAQKWLRSATSEEGFSPDEIVEEKPAPLNHVGQVLLPQNYDLPEDTKTGQFVLKQFKPNYYILEHNILPSSPFSLQVGLDVFDWYSFDEGILLKEISPQNPTKMMQVLNNLFAKNPLDGKSNNKFALHIPDESNSWHFFKISKNTSGGFQLAYLVARNINKELYLRTKDIFDDQVLEGKKVTIIGLGALGSEVGKSLARNAVGHFNLFDKDTFEVGNSVRHAADLFYIGEHKVEVAKQLILRSNPNITVNSFKIDVLNDNGLLETSLANSDLCIVLTAEDSVDYMINDVYIPNFNIPFIFARVSAGGLSGSIQVIKYQDTPCLRCLSAKGVDKLPVPRKEITFEELPPEYGSCSSPAFPGSEIDTKEIALQVSRIALQELMSNEASVYPASKGNQFYWHGPMGSEGEAPFTWEIKNLKKYTECPTCGSIK